MGKGVGEKGGHGLQMLAVIMEKERERWRHRGEHHLLGTLAVTMAW
jgi:hypothetical protein